MKSKSTLFFRLLFPPAFLLLCLAPVSVLAQTPAAEETLTLSRGEFETLFLKQNLELLAEKLSIEKAEALKLQAALWPNPTLSLEQVNLWTSRRQRESLDQTLPALPANIAPNTQFSIQIEQQIQTAGKRRKNLQARTLEVEIARQTFQELLRQLKLEFRSNLLELAYFQELEKELNAQQESIGHLLQSFQRQSELGALSRAELVRLQALYFEISKELKDSQSEKMEIEKKIQVSLNLPQVRLLLRSEGAPPRIENQTLPDLSVLLALALENRPDLKVRQISLERQKALLKVEKAQRVPDVYLSGSYDRGGGIWPGFVGFGLSIDLPVFNKNQGNIKHAQLEERETELLRQHTETELHASLYQQLRRLKQSQHFMQSIPPDYPAELEELLSSHIRNLREQHISLLTFLDFQETYIENKKIILNAQRDLALQFELLQYQTGTEIHANQH